ncbi:dTMP kinase [Pasteurella skyensis]|uniref:Thymidylate kinase n=1 Tax=Phocoenobacter skyensis TaxID=97481 RepID=A0AAJ6P024_9PAST|nr:dTMP kinase [Pasteurella skyensis]MDP8161972.1 dTMP kinase [Pasteurella skyensis]MDP8172128.1 dTMP kinase [Pasteurella skyensis]MDP8176524.1 dTMP kinase [Pasteurella skyensis]MDP8178412.1 dTMP kinase [Pasteurella skyensis]MDP8182832.1 dTMP kinase [Pasteurella skyensis]
MKAKGKFIVIEGLEGAGKSNAQNIVMEILHAHHIDFITTREPGGTPIAEALRTLWKKGMDGEHTTDKAELLMLYASRTQLVETIIQPALEKGVWVIGDRHNMSTQAYQGGGRGLSEVLLDQIKTAILGDFEPDLTLYLDLDPKVGLERAKGRGELDRIEQQHIDFFHRTRERYLALVAQNPKAIKINAEQDLESVSNDIRQAIENWLSHS